MNNFLLALVLSVSLIGDVGCHRSPRTPDELVHEVTTFKVAMLTPGSISDSGWNAAAFDGMQHIKDNLAAASELVQTTSADEFELDLRDLASRGFNLIFANGSEYTPAVLKVAGEFPKATFVLTSGSATSTNVASLNFKMGEATYVEGVLAGGMSKSGIAGAVGGRESPAIKLAFEGFNSGFESVNPHAKVLTGFTGNFDNVAAAKQAASSQIAEGADFLIANADAGSLGVFQAAAQSHLYAFGSSRSQNAMMPDVVLASAVADIPDALLHIASEVKSGTFKSGMVTMGLKEGMVKVIYNEKLKARIPKAALDRAETAEKDIIAGKLIVPVATQQ